MTDSDANDEAWIVTLWARRIGLAAVIAVVMAMTQQVTAQTTDGRLGIVEEVRIEGTRRIEPQTVRSYMVINPGDAFDAEKVNQSLKSLYATGLFTDVTMRREGGALIVMVTENPIINQIAFEGNAELDTEVLDAEVQLRSRVVYTRSKVQQDVKRLLEVYRRAGMYSVKIEPKIISLPQNRVNLVFEISEGEPTGVRRIQFNGNKAFSDSKLRGVIQTSETAWWRLFATSDSYDPDRVTFDRELLRRFYLSEGYADFKVLSAVAELAPDGKDFFLTFSVEEGERYRFGSVDITTLLRGVDVEGLRSVVTTETGDWYDAEAIDSTISKITEELGKLGFAFIDIRPQVDRDPVNRVINIVYEIGEGPKVFVERIDIIGNVRTEDEVIRREFQIVEGDAFNTTKLNRSQQRVRNLGYFGNVDVRNVPGSQPDRTVVEVEVEEQATGELSFGFGFSTVDGPIGDIQIRERNLLGKGQDLRLSFRGSARTQNIDLGFTEPYFLDRPLAAGFDAFRTTSDRQDESSFDQTETGGALRVRYRITEELSQSLRYTLKQTEISDVSSDASVFIQSQEGEATISEVSQALTYDARDNRFRPTEGYVATWRSSIAGLGGSVNYVQNRLNGAYFYSLFEDVVLAVSGEVGYVFALDGDDVRLADRFFLGSNQMRGFEVGGIGPRDTSTDDALGGERFYTSTVQVDFPLGLPEELGINGRVFVDAGSLWSIPDTGSNIFDDSGLRAAAGTGIGWVSPFGPINIDFALPILKQDDDKTESVRVSFGTSF